MAQYMLDTDIASYGFEHRNAALDNRHFQRLVPPLKLENWTEA